MDELHCGRCRDEFASFEGGRLTLERVTHDGWPSLGMTLCERCYLSMFEDLMGVWGDTRD